MTLHALLDVAYGPDGDKVVASLLVDGPDPELPGGRRLLQDASLAVRAVLERHLDANPRGSELDHE